MKAPPVLWPPPPKRVSAGLDVHTPAVDIEGDPRDSEAAMNVSDDAVGADDEGAGVVERRGMPETWLMPPEKNSPSPNS